jgi:hypothetical protein
VRYHRPILARFLALALPSLVLLLGVSYFVVELAGIPTGLALGPGAALPALFVIGTWALEAVALTALFLLVYGRSAGGFLDGLYCALVAWLFRGPILVLTVAGALGSTAPDLRSSALPVLVIYALCGTSLAALARRFDLRPDP